MEKARLFLRQAAACGTADRDGFVANLEAAIVFGRSVTLHLQKEYRHRPGFDEWYAARQAEMRADPVCEFFNEARTLILKVGPLAVRRVITVDLALTVMASVAMEATIIRGAPWYRRSPRIIWEDLRAETRRVVSRLSRWLRPPRPSAPPGPTRTVVRDGFYFPGSAWPDRPAEELVRHYLDGLEPIVRAADARFAEPPPSS